MQYKPQTGEYKVVPRSAFSKFGNDKSILGISLGQKYHEGTKFKALVDWSVQRFNHTTIMIADTLQRHNLMLRTQISEEEAIKTLRGNSQAWRSRNQNSIKGLNVLTWNELLENSSVQIYLDQIWQLYETNQDVYSVIDKTVQEYFIRQRSKEPEFYNADNFEAIYKSSRDYLLEEIAVDSYITNDLNTTVIYPGSLSSHIIVGKNGQPSQEFKFIEVALVRNKIKENKAA